MQNPNVHRLGFCTNFRLLVFISTTYGAGEWESLWVSPVFRRNRVNFPNKLAGLTQTSQSNRILHTMYCHAQYLSGTLVEAGDLLLRNKLSIRWWEHRMLSVLFLSIIVVIFFSFCRSVKLFLSQHMSFAFSLRFSSPSHQGGGGNEIPTPEFFVASWG